MRTALRGRPDDGSVHGLMMALLAPNTPAQVQMETNFIEAARRAGVQHLVQFSGLGADIDSPARISRCHAMVERTLEESGIPFTHLRPNTFMQNILGAAPAIASRGSLEQPMNDLTVSLVDVRDIAAVAATVLTEPGHIGNITDVHQTDRQIVHRLLE